MLRRLSAPILMAVKPPYGDIGPSDFGANDDDDDENDEAPGSKNSPPVSSGSNKWDEGLFGDSEDEYPTLNNVICSQLEETLQGVITEMAINTCRYYMTEFRDEVSLQYIINLHDFGNKKFAEKGWRDYLETMIKTDKHDVYVTMTPPKVFLKSRNIDPKRNVKVQYAAKIEPRKIANQILTVRENVCEEIMQDLQSLRNENNEAARFAKVWTEQSYAAAEKTRRPIRMSNQAESTPNRDKNINELNILVTNYAIDLLRANELNFHLSASEHERMVEYLDTNLKEMTEEFEAKDPAYQHMNQFKAPQMLMERLYHNGLEAGVSVSTEEDVLTVNQLKLAQELFKLRIIVMKEAIRLVSNMSLQSRPYYKMIKDLGGFSRIDLSGRPKYTIIDLDEEKAKEEKLAEEEKKEQELLAVAAAKKKQEEEEVEETIGAGILSSDSVHADEDVDLSRDPNDFLGPVMM
eukprot:CAMPEP_0182416828 /NCGR_PEP_ID=MMETSP1167-20130531/1199_1 /TAXON_ID=2988 /ORGANISM="Mallomonas Sp, Strain CCMP3275" /LENGTH=462 /DNA_ID=CAMNT_0024589929 /DNA_START=198 /DNA_END=1586 /DNA_ORIENTATION=+